jgi:hypothetical protein
MVGGTLEELQPDWTAATPTKTKQLTIETLVVRRRKFDFMLCLPGFSGVTLTMIVLRSEAFAVSVYSQPVTRGEGEKGVRGNGEQGKNDNR